jgi:NitT/TauT family transport system substrate-binding protein
VDASIIGWVNFMYGDRSAANALMIRDNPELSEQEIEASLVLMKQQGIVDSGQAESLGIGAMAANRIQDFYEQMVRAGVYQQKDVDLNKVANTQFVNKKVGLDLKQKLLK